MNLKKLTIKTAHEGLITKKFTDFELVKAYLKQIKKQNKKINAFITLNDEEALNLAKKIDEKIKNKEKINILEGIPFGLKDAICSKDLRSTAGAKILDNYKPSYEATVVKKLKNAGAILIGKQNCDAFGHGASNEHSMYGPVKNPHNLKKVAGGSSGGSAAAVAANMCLFSLGEDTGGSIRQPASLCGIVGFRPSYGRNSRYGVMPMASSFDVVGPFAKNVEDISYIMEIIAGQDKKDATTIKKAVPKYSTEIKKELKSLKIGIPKEYFEMSGLDLETKKIIEEKIKKIEKQGHKIINISLPLSKYALPVYYILVPSEDSSNLARIDSIRYGIREENTQNLYDLYAKSRQNGLEEEVKRRIMIGTFALSAGYFDAYYKKAMKVRTLIIKEFQNAFENVDFILTPTSPFPAFDLGGKKDDVLAMYSADIFVCPPAVAGLPAISIPVGKTKKKLPVGLQIIGKQFADSEVLRVAYNFENK
ncbi:MAG: Asp-tRNA(Asn)/Glu-tRNA(Gln) amidotransferase subunit GatA [Patescibacteria group bacterium]